MRQDDFGIADIQRVIDLLDRLSRRSGKTLLMATHSAEMMGIADRILTIEGGGLRERVGDRSA